MRSGKEEASPVRNPGEMRRPVLGVRHRRSGHGRRWLPTWYEIPVPPPAWCNALIGTRLPVRHALVAVVMAVAALCGGNRAHAQQETSSSRDFTPPASEQPTPFSSLLPQSVIHTSSPADTVHFCLPVDFEEWEGGQPISAAKRQGDLNVGEPGTVRMIYFLPNDRSFRADVVQNMKDEIRNAQTFYAEQMHARGYGDETFRFETDAQGEPLVHRVDGQHPDSYYIDDTYRRVYGEIDRTFDLYANVYAIVIDNSTDIIRWNGRSWGGFGIRQGRNGGFALATHGFYPSLLAHELGHAFGLLHDFNDKAYIMSYGRARDRLSACNAEFLAVHPYFSIESSIYQGLPPSIELVSPATYSAGSESVPVQLEVSDSEGLHQSILFVRTIAPHSAEGFLEVKACRGLSGVQNDVVEFDYDGAIPSADGTSLYRTSLHSMYVKVTDTDGNVGGKLILLSEILPAEAALLGNYPNPFNSETTIGYALPHDAKVRLVVYDLLGHEVVVLVDGPQPAGRRAVRFSGDHLPSGLYAYRLQAGNEVVVRTMILAK